LWYSYDLSAYQTFVLLHAVPSCSFTYVSHLFICSSMALQPFLGLWPLLQLRNLFYTDDRTPWTSYQPVAKSLPTHRTRQTQSKRTQTSMPRVGFEPMIPAFERAKTVHTLDSAATAIGVLYFTQNKYLSKECIFLEDLLSRTAQCHAHLVTLCILHILTTDCRKFKSMRFGWRPISTIFLEKRKNNLKIKNRDTSTESVLSQIYFSPLGER
jgi:hypothetical protein